MKHRVLLLSAFCLSFVSLHASDLSSLKKDQEVSHFRVVHLYSNSTRNIIGAKFSHISTGAPVFLLQLETVPQALTWVNTPADSNRGLPHSLEHLLVAKGTKGRYFHLLQEMRLSQTSARTSLDFTAYGLSSGDGVDGFFELFHALLDALYRPDFTDAEAEGEFYHFGIGHDQTKRTLAEQGTVYAEQQAVQGRYTYTYELNRLIMGEGNPLALDSLGAVDEMRNVTPTEIRAYHKRYYRLSPRTGFIFVFPPDQDVAGLLEKISRELDEFSQSATATSVQSAAQGSGSEIEPKYPIHPSENVEPVIHQFPGANAAGPSFIHIAWKPGRAESQGELCLLQVLMDILAGGEDSLLQRAVVDSKTRALDSGATSVTSAVLLPDSPSFPVPLIEIGGIPGNQLTAEKIKELSQVLVNRIREVAEYADGSEGLREFNRTAEARIFSLQRAEAVSTKEAPGLGLYRIKTDWKTQFERLELDPSFIRPVGEEPAWQRAHEQVQSGRNVWRELIQKFHLLDIPYATATAPSPKLLEEVGNQTQTRIKNKLHALMVQYATEDEQEALARFEHDEQVKASQIDKIAASVSHPRFTAHPPLLPDEQIQYREFRVQNVPVLASTYNAPSTIDVGLSFDLRKIPSDYYKYLPLFVKCLDSIGLKKSGQVTPYALLRRRIDKDTYAFSTGYEIDPIAPRMDFTIRFSVTTKEELHSAFGLMQDLMTANYLEAENVDRLRDLVATNMSADDWYPRQDVAVLNAGYAFYYKDDPLFFALQSRFTRAHWNSRLKWLLHPAVDASEIARVEDFARQFLSSLGDIPRQEVARRLNDLKEIGVQAELAEYWKKNLPYCPDAEVAECLRQLASEVTHDLRTGIDRTIEDLRTLQRLVLNRGNLRVDVMTGRAEIADIQSDLAPFLQSITTSSLPATPSLSSQGDPAAQLTRKLRARYPSFENHSPWTIGFVNPDNPQGFVVFYGQLPGYSQVDHKSLVDTLAGKVFAGRGPQTFFAKTLERGLAYDNGIVADTKWRVVWYSASRSPDIPSLIDLVNATASELALDDRSLVDYTLSQTFTFSREMNTFSDRARALAQDLRDGNDPAKIRRFAQATLRLRQDPSLARELRNARISAICGVLLRDECNDRQRAGRSLFFFMGTEKVLTDAEKRLSIPKLFLLWPSDYWLE